MLTRARSTVASTSGAEAKGEGMPKYVEVQMTDKDAARLLNANDENRRLRGKAAERWSLVFLRGEWDPNTAEAIKVRGTFARPGRLQDGQHRLEGLRLAYDAQPTLEPPKMTVAEGVPDDTRVTLDTGIKRTFGDVLTWRGETQAVLLGGVVLLSWRVTVGRFIGTGGTYTYAQLLDELEGKPWLRDGISDGRKIGKRFRVSTTGCSYACAAIRHDGGPEALEGFTSALLEGADLPREHPILHLRNLMVEWGQRSKGTQTGPLAHVVAGTMLKAYALERDDELAVDKRAIRWPSRANPGESFPKL